MNLDLIPVLQALSATGTSSGVLFQALIDSGAAPHQALHAVSPMVAGVGPGIFGLDEIPRQPQGSRSVVGDHCGCPGSLAAIL